MSSSPPVSLGTAVPALVSLGTTAPASVSLDTAIPVPAAPVEEQTEDSRGKNPVEPLPEGADQSSNPRRRSREEMEG